MRKVISLILVLMILFSAVQSPALAAAPKISNEMDKMVQGIIDEGKSKGAVLSIVREGNIELCKGYGWADEYLDIASNGENIAFRIGSVSKTFVAVAALILEENGMLNMDSDVSIYLDSDFPNLSYPVSMRQLLTHTAGFEDMVTGMAFYNVSDTEPLGISVRKYLPEQIYESGEIISYSNYGIALAAYIVECITGQDFALFCEREIFEPLNMNRTTFKFMHDIAYVSKAYLPNGNETIEPYMNLYPEGSAVSTAEDMAKYMCWLMNSDDNRILSPNFKEELFKKQFTVSEDLEGIGYIWNRKAQNEKIYYDKKGETLNFYTRIALYPQENTGIFLSFNTYVAEHEINAIISKATDLIYGEKKEYIAEHGKLSIDISGLYVNNWSNFTTPEKIIRYIVPSKMVHIDAEKDGYYINGEKMTLVGEDLYSSNLGLLKFQEKGNKAIMSSAAISYIKVPMWQHKIIQMIIPLIFIILTFIIFIVEIIGLRKASTKHKYSLLLNSLFQIISFIMLCLMMYKGIASFSILKYASYMKFFGWFMGIVVILNIIIVRKNNRYKKLMPFIWIVSGILFTAWMIFFNIL